MSEFNYLTKDKYEELKAELEYLKTKERGKIAKVIQEARELGDLSENAEYHAAKDAQGLLELKISKLDEVVAMARIIDTSHMEEGKVYLLSKVKVKNLKSNKLATYIIVSEEEADLKQSKISVKSPVGKALIGGEVGDVVDVHLPNGNIIQFEILEITLGHDD